MTDIKHMLVVTALLVSQGYGKDFNHLKHADEVYPNLLENGNAHPVRFYQPVVKETASDPYSIRRTKLYPIVEETASDPYIIHILHNHYKRQTSPGMFASFDPNKFNSQIGAGYNPNALNGMGSGGMSSGMQTTGQGSGSGTGTGSGSGTTSGGSSSGGGITGMFNPNAMMSGTGGSGGSSGGMSMFGNPSAMMGGGSPSVTSTATGGSSPSGTSSGTVPHYDPNNVVNTGARYDPNAAGNPGGGGGGSVPTFANGMGMNASQQVSGGSPPGAASSTPASGPGAQNPASSFGSSANSFGSSSSGSGSSGGSQSSGNTAGNSGSQSGGGSSAGSSGFDPLKSNSMATDGFNPLNPMLGKDMTSLMGPQGGNASGSGSNSFGFDPSKMNAQLGSQGMSLNMFGGAGGNTNLNKADASSLMTGAQGMMAGSNSVLGGGNAVMNGGGNMGTGSSGSGGQTSGGSSGSGGQTSGGSSGGSTFDPNQGGSSSGSGSGSSGGTFDPNLQTGSGSGSSGSGSSGSSSGGSSGGMNMFDPNAMMGGGTGVNPMMPGGSGGMNPMMPGGNMNPMMPSSGSSGNRDSSGGSSVSSILDPMGAMTGSAKNFSGGPSLVDPMGFMGGGGLTGNMGNMFSPQGRVRKDSTAAWRNGNMMDLLTGRMYNHMDPMGYSVEGMDPGDGVMSSGGQLFVPSFVRGGMFQNAPNYQNAHTEEHKATIPSSPSLKPAETGPTNDTRIDAKHSENKLPDPIHSVEITTESGIQVPGIRPLLMRDQIPESVLNTVNITNMIPDASFRGEPGMLGYGPSTGIAQPRATTNITVDQNQISDPVFKGYPGIMGLVGQPGALGGQRAPTVHSIAEEVIKQDLGMYQNVKPINNYNGLHIFKLSPELIEKDTESTPNVQHSPVQAIQPSHVQLITPITSGYDWSGEWPGDSDSDKNQDWSSGWAKNWDNHEVTNNNINNNNNNNNNNNKNNNNNNNSNNIIPHPVTPASNNGKDDGDTAGFMSSDVHGNTGDLPAPVAKSRNTLGDMQKSLDVFEQFLSFLRDLDIPVGDNGNTKNDLSYNELARGWAKDVHA